MGGFHSFNATCNTLLLNSTFNSSNCDKFCGEWSLSELSVYEDVESGLVNYNVYRQNDNYIIQWGVKSGQPSFEDDLYWDLWHNANVTGCATDGFGTPKCFNDEDYELFCPAYFNNAVLDLNDCACMQGDDDCDHFSWESQIAVTCLEHYPTTASPTSTASTTSTTSTTSECVGAYETQDEIGKMPWHGLDTCFGIELNSGGTLSYSYTCVDEERVLVGYKQYWLGSKDCPGTPNMTLNKASSINCEGVVCDTVEYDMYGWYNYEADIHEYSQRSVIINECVDSDDGSSSAMTTCSESEVGIAYYDGPGCVGAMVDFADVLPHNQTECIEIVSWSVSLCTICTFCTFCTFC